jgi:hypothetical protein
MYLIAFKEPTGRFAMVEGQVGDAGPPGARHSLSSRYQEAQVLQLPELQPEQALFPPAPETVCGIPLAEVVKAAKTDIFCRAGLWHLGHSADWPD